MNFRKKIGRHRGDTEGVTDRGRLSKGKGGRQGEKDGGRGRGMELGKK